MSNKFKEIYIKNRMYYFFENIINIKNLDPNKIKINEKSHKNISANPLYLIIDKMNEESNGNKYLMPSKDAMTKHEELWNKSEILLDQ